EGCPIVAGEHLGLQKLCVRLDPGDGVEAKRRAVLAPCRDDQPVVGQSAAYDIGHLVEPVANVGRAGHGVQQTSQAVDTLAAQRFAVDYRGVFEGQSQHV